MSLPFPLRPKTMRALSTGGLLAWCVVIPSSRLAAEYRPPQDRTIYDDWARDLQDKRAAQERANAYKPGPAQPRDDSARLASDRFMREQNKASDAYNARVGRENARIDAQNAYYAQLRELIAAVNAGNVPAMWRYGYTLWERSDSSPREKEIGLSWIREAAGRGNPDAKTWIAQQGAALVSKASQISAQADTDRFESLVADARAGSVSAMGTLAIAYYNTGTREQRQAATEWRRRAIANNESRALYYFRDQFELDDGDPEYRAQALDVRLKLAEREKLSPKRAYELGHCFLTGKFGAPVDRDRAMTYLDQAAAAGMMEAHLRMAEAFAHGIGGPMNTAAAAARYEAALDDDAKQPLTGAERSSAALAFLSLILAPGYGYDVPNALTRLCDEEIYGVGPEADALGRLASDAINSGRAGFSDLDRALLYESRPVRYGTWTGFTNEERAERSLRFAETVLARIHNTARPLEIMERRVVRLEASGDTTPQPHYSKVDAQPKDLLPLLVFAARNAAVPKAETYLLAAGIAAGMTTEEISAQDLPGNLLFSLYDEAARKCDDPTAWLECGRMLISGQQVATDARAAMTCFERAWEKGEAKAAYYMVGFHQHRVLPGAGKSEAWTWMERGASRHEPRCMELWGNHLVAAGLTDKDEKAIAEGRAWLEQAAAAGMAGANADLAEIYENGYGVTADNEKSVALLQQAVEGGSARAKRIFAERLAQGRGVAIDQARAMKLLYEAAKDDLTAANNLGVVLWRGDWGEKDPAAGLQWMEVTLEAGSWQTGRSLAKIYHLGLGVDADEERARGYLEKAGAMGGAESAAAIAEFYEKGEIIAKDPDAAQRWREKANSVKKTT